MHIQKELRRRASAARVNSCRAAQFMCAAYSSVHFRLQNKRVISCVYTTRDPAGRRPAGSNIYTENCPLCAECGQARKTPEQKGGVLDAAPGKDDIPTVFYKHYPAYAHGDLNVSEFARVCGLSRQTVYKYLKIILNII